MRRHHGHEAPGRNSRPHDAEWMPAETEDGGRLALGTLEIEKVPETDIDPVADDGAWREVEVAEIVHDLKNPLTTIALEMTLLSEKLAFVAAPEVRGAMFRITRNVAFIDRLVQDILDSSAIEAGSFTLQRKPTELCGLLAQIIDRSVSSRDRARVYVDAPGRVVLSIDGFRIERVVANLVQNALKYSSTDSSVIVRLERVSGRVRVSVIDGGPGIDKDDQERLFQRHQRAEQARRHEGSGLGLYVARRIVEAHGGMIGVDSVPNVGSRFFFELPLL